MGQMKRYLLPVSLLLCCSLNVVETSPHCSGAFFSVSDCLDFVLEGSVFYPQQGGACCIELASVVKHSRSCLCEAAVEATRLGMQINVSRALLLLSVCKIISAPISNCDIGNSCICNFEFSVFFSNFSFLV
jgi:Probable lipid transfer